MTNIGFTSGSKRHLRRGPVVFAGMVAMAALAGCSAASTPQSSPVAPSTTAASSAPAQATYQLHMDFFSHESKLGSVIDPQVFQSSPGAPAGSGPQGITHAAGTTPAAKAADPGTALLAADGSALNITLGQWEKAAGTVSFSCTAGQEEAASQLTGLIPNGSYSTFVVHLDVQGPGRFTPWGDSQGSTNNFTADAGGTATVTNTVSGCLGNREAAVIIWHSDGKPHGTTPGTLGVTWHNSLITPLP
ncbi:hypothetical protein [Pseudarthrobacter enclensis]|uniref:Uncharacterized protein n=1 Tax=Pseudarthrobacter enclensis TaxID=993070 RepID=A0ABT9RXY4_9MICC|nr:hypothetical protein [Pseudarthrobacter enclensis]MDP9890102.1 hypothetical protein [Pseudarthrobacter enclensis]